jgi:hypothetical protein
VRALRLLAVAAGLVALAATAGSTSRAASDAAPVRAAAVAAGLAHTCVLTAAGAVSCWGYNGHDELGNGQTGGSVTPVAVAGMSTGIANISVGVRHSCAVTSVGGVKCWGYGRGALGDGTIERRRTPVDVVGLASGVTAVAAGYDVGCALVQSGGVKCWGAKHLAPVDVPGLASGVKAIAAGGLRTCALMVGGNVQCWGSDLVAVDVPGLAGATAITASCALTASGGVECWGSSGAPADVPGLASGVIAITSSFHSCALLASGSVKCWGSNQHGELGDGTRIDRPTPVDVVGLHGPVAAVSAGSFHTCALLRSGAVDCWGSDATQQLPDGTPVDHLRPVAVAGFGVAKATLAIVSRTIPVTRGRVAPVHVRCGSALRCRGTLELAALHARLASRAFSIPAGAAEAVPVTLTRRGYENVLRSKRLAAHVGVTGAVTASRAVILVAPS